MKPFVRSLLFVVAFFGAALVSAAEPTAKININTAAAAELSAGLHGVGDAKAQAIVAWREEHGPFKAAAQLAEVKGIGDALIEKNRDRITVE